MRKAAVIFSILIVLVLGGLVLAPQLVDLNRFKDQIAAELGARTGRTVELAGPIGLSLLPAPVVTARDVRLANPSGAAVKDMVRLRALEVKLAVWPLLTGKIEVRSATLVEPEIDVERLADGTGNWRLAGAPPKRRPAASSSARLAVAIDHLAIQNGAVTYRSGAAIERFEHINGTLSLASLAGPFEGAFTLVARGAEFHVEGRSGRLDAAEVPLRFVVTAKPAARLQFDGVLGRSAGGRHLAGKLKLTAENAQVVLGTLARLPLPAMLARPLALSGDLTGAPGAVKLDHLAVDLGAAHGEGSLRLATGTPLDLTLALSLNRLDLDRWLAARKAALMPAHWWSMSAFAAVPDSAPIPPAQQARAGVALPAGINAHIDLGVDALLWRGGLIRDARLKLALANGRLTLERLAALLPGGADVSLRGSGKLAADGPHAQGVIEANADDLRGLLRWFGIALDRVPADRLRRASLTTRFTLAGDRLDLAAADATLDTTSLSGAATVLLRARPGIGLRLAADRFNLDAYLPHGSGSAPVPAARTASPGGGKGLALPFDANIDARVQQLTWRGQPLGAVHLAGTLQDGEATIRELSVGDAGGASGKLSGVIEGMSGGLPKGQLAFDLHGPEFERMLRLISPKLAIGRLYGAFSLGGGLEAEEGKISLDADLQVLGGHAHVSGEIAPAADKADLDFDAGHPGLARLLRGFFPGYRPAGGDPGALKLAGHLKRDGTRLTVKPLSLAIGASTLDGTLGITLGGVRPLVAADLTIGDWAIDRLLPARDTAMIDHVLHHAGLMPGVVLAAGGDAAPSSAGTAWSSAPIDLAALGVADVDLHLSGKSVAYGAWRVEQPAVAATLSDKVLTVQRFAGTLFGGSLEASGVLAGSAAPKFSLKLALANADLKAALVQAVGFHLAAGRFDLAADLAASGASPADLIAHLAGDGTLKAQDGSLSGISLKSIDDRLNAPDPPADLLSLVHGGAGGETAFSTLAGSFHVADGVARSDDLHLTAEGGEGSGTLNLDFPRWTMTSRVEFRLTGVANAPPLVMHLDGALDAPRTVFEVNALQQFLAQRAPDAKPPAQP